MPTSPVLKRSIQRVIQTLIILLTLYYTLLGGSPVGVHESRWRSLTFIITGLLLGSWLVNKLIRKQPWPRTPLDWPILAVIVTMTLSTLTSTDPRLSLGTLLLTLIYGLGFYFAVDLATHEALVEKIIKAILLTALVICAVGLFEYWQWYYGSWLGDVNRSEAGMPWALSASRRIKSVLNSPNTLAYYLLPILGLSLYKFNHTTHWLRRSAWAAWVLWVLGTLFLTQSRGGLLGAGAVLITFAGLRFLDRQAASSLPRFQASPRPLLGMMAILAFLLLLWPIVSRTFALTSLDLGQRDNIWQIALAVIWTFPWLGSGPGTFGQQYLAFRQTGSDYIHSHAHNLWLTLTAEGGLIGLGAILWLSAAFLRAIPHSFQATHQKSRRLLTSAALAGLAGMSVHNLLDDFLDYPMLTLYTIFLVALSLNLSPAKAVAVSSTRFKILPTVVAMILALVIGSSVLWFQPAFTAYDLARASAEKDDWRQAAEHLEQAVTADPGYRFYQQQLVLAYGKLAVKDSSLLSPAIAKQTILLQQNDHYPVDYANLACLYQQANDLSTAIQTMAHAANLEPAQVYGYRTLRVSRLAYQFSLVQLYEQAGQVDAAQEVLARILENQPWMAASPFWRERSQQLQALIDQIENRSSDRSPERLAVLADLHYYAGNYPRALEIIEQLLQSEGETESTLIRLGQALAATDQPDAALTALDQALTIDPFHPGAHLSRAQIFSQQRQLEEAEAEVKAAIALVPSAEAYTVWGELAEQQGLWAEAKERYGRAIFEATALETNYAHLVGRREPLPEETLACIIVPYPEQQLSQPALALGRLLEKEGKRVEAVKIYELLLRYEPYNRLAQKRLSKNGN